MASDHNKRSLLGYVVAAIGVGLPFAMQVGPDEAFVNLCKWPRKAFPSLSENCLPGVSASQVYIVAIVLVAIGLIWLTHPYRHSGTRRHKMAVGISLLCFSIVIGIWGLSIIASGDDRPTKIAGAAPPHTRPTASPQTDPAKSSSIQARPESDQKATRIAIWQSINRQMDELAKLLNAGYSMLDNWLTEVKSDREHEMQNWATLKNSFEVFRTKLDRLRNSYDDREINDALQPVALPPGRPSPPYTLFHSLNISIEAFVEQLRGSGDPIPESIEDDMRAHVGLLLRDLNRIRDWQSTTKNISGVRVNELSIVTTDAPPAAAKPANNPKPEPPKQLTMKDLLTDEFPGVLRHEGVRTYTFNGGAAPLSVAVVVYQDPRSGGEFLGFYVPEIQKTFDVVKDVFEHHVEILNAIRGTATVEIRGQGEPTGLSSKDTKFSGKVFVYYDNQMTLQELAQLDTFARSLGLSPAFRDRAYLIGRQQIKRERDANVR